ncbi:hypothetical protein V1512DRAFT_260222 [Lipomyces arxii]|uniref:uncharacterized protein n=1 Tax=Lipomyces arxii TaxID=56418 RepID=UPI0034CEE5E7
MNLISRTLSNGSDSHDRARSRSTSPALKLAQKSLPSSFRRDSTFNSFSSPKRRRSTSGNLLNSHIVSMTARARHVNVILELDLNCNILWISRSWTNVVGTDSQELIGRPVSEILVGNEDVFQKATDAMLETNSSYRVRFTTIRGDLAKDLDELAELTDERQSSAPNSTAVTSTATSVQTSSNSSRRPSFSQDEQSTSTADDLVNSRPSTPVRTQGHHQSIIHELAHSATVEIANDDQTDQQDMSLMEQLTSPPETTSTVEMEGQGIIIFDRHSLEPCYSMWVLKPYMDPIRPVIDLPQTLVDSLGFGADVLASYLTRLAQAKVTDPKDCPMQEPIMCRICERQIQPWWFERHSELCLVEHKAESDVQICQDALREHERHILKVLEQFEAQSNHGSTVEYRGLPIAPSIHRTSSSSSNSSSSSSHKLPMALQHLKHLGKYKSPVRTLELLLDLCQISLAVNTPALRDNNPSSDGEGGYQIRIHTPDSETRLKQVLSWQTPSNIEEEGLALLCHDTERVAKAKIEAILRLGNTITYSEKIQRELSVLVQEVIEETVSQNMDRQQAEDEADQSEADDIAMEADDAGFFAGYLSQFQDESNEERVPSPGLVGYNSSTMSLASGSSPRELLMTPRSFSSSFARPKSRKSTLQDEEGMDSDSSRSSLVYLREKADSPVSEPETLPHRNVMSRKSSTGFMIGSPHRQKSPSLSYSKSPLMVQKLKLSTMPDSESINNVSFTPLSSPLLFPIDSYTDQTGGRHHRRKSSTASDFSKAPLSPLLSSVTPAVRPAQPSIKDFEVIKPISRGAFGSVYLTKKKNTGDYFAIKVLKKSDMIAKNQVTNVKAERAIMMAQAESPFVAKLFFTFQSKEYLYLVMEYLNGGDCAALLKAFGGGLPEEWAKKYVAEVVLGIENLHERGIVHRDLKPDNLLIDKNGHLKLTDFGLSRMGLIGRQARARNSTMVEPPDIFQSSQSTPRALSATLFSAGLDTPLFVDPAAGHGVSPSSTPLLGAETNFMNVPGYWSLNKGSSLSEYFPKSFTLTPSVTSKGESIHTMLNSFSLSGGTLSTSASRHASKEGEDEVHQGSVSSSSSEPTTANAGPLSNVSSRGHSSSESTSSSMPQSTSSSMPPPPVPSHATTNLALFDPGNEPKKFVGTPDYLAPETIMGTNQDEMSDWWSLGCIVFEFLYGYPPFHADTPTEVFENILARRIAWPPVEDFPNVSPEAVDLINKLICTDPVARLGAETSEQVKVHPFFDDINWETLCDEEAPFVPNPVNEEDTAYFDDRGAILQTFPEEEADEAADKKGTDKPSVSPGDVVDGSESARKDSKGNVIGTGIRSKLMPLHIPHHFRGRRARRLSEPVPADDFGSFSFKNLNVLEKANKDAIQRLKSEHMEHMKAPIMPAQPSGLIEPSPIKPRNASVGGLGSAISLGFTKPRPSSPSSSSSSSSSLYRSISPSRNLQHVSIPSSPLTTSVPINAPDQPNELKNVKTRASSGSSLPDSAMSRKTSSSSSNVSNF